jgi:hypothetical protein
VTHIIPLFLLPGLLSVHVFKMYTQQQHQTTTRYELDDGEGVAEGDETAGDGNAAAGGGGNGKYVPPSQRGSAGGMGSSLANMQEVDDRDLKTLRVSNISTDTKEADLQV